MLHISTVEKLVSLLLRVHLKEKCIKNICENRVIRQLIKQ